VKSQNESEVFDMVNFKWDQKRALEIAKEDGFADGIAVGEAHGKRKATMKIALSLLKKGLPVGVITDSTNLSLEEIRKIAKDNGLAF
jgi:predicted transposase/invertase (TIGR01784 family)